MALPRTASGSSNSTLFPGSREREVAGAAIQHVSRASTWLIHSTFMQEVPLWSLSRRGWRQHDERGDRRREAILLQGQDVLEGHPADGGRHARGYGHISSIDISSSRKFLQRFLREGPNQTGTSCALDCGAGIGRITKRLLLPLFRAVDMVDVTEDFLAKAKTYLGEEGKRVRNYFCCGLQDFSPEPNSYDVIWIQWVIDWSPHGLEPLLLQHQAGSGGFSSFPAPQDRGARCLKGHLTDQHLAEFLRRCKRGLRPNGIIVIKDNMAQEGVILDDVDSSVCRDLEVVHGIVRSAGLSLLAQERQENLPDEIYHVYSLALR
ncbi:hypothetical protein QTO34_005062 [Cnephaeus nilssonii]|uniref:N-terminal Xaa-Pro-Lys N-methyltransferase 1 n=1 Tax=Cnephaeus nilssonii TaxID=3371016 RepID=A0AA40HNJ9_CNENI|nr:hypothetical protein QTO34_005062 [Eptesicus nilssonii]